MKISRTLKILSVLALLAITAVLASACSASQQEYNTTWTNRQRINEAIPVPSLDFSTRRLVLAKYYLVLERPRLNTCSYLAGRGNYGEAVIPTFGPSVNLSNQMTNGEMSEPDSVFVGPNDQTLVVLRNGNFATVEADVVTVGGDCPEGLRPDSPLQTMLEFASGTVPEPALDFTTTEGLNDPAAEQP